MAADRELVEAIKTALEETAPLPQHCIFKDFSHEEMETLRDDIKFSHRMRKTFDNVTVWVGRGVVLAALGVVFYIIKLGWEAFINLKSGG